MRKKCKRCGKILTVKQATGIHWCNPTKCECEKAHLELPREKIIT